VKEWSSCKGNNRKNKRETELLNREVTILKIFLINISKKYRRLQLRMLLILFFTYVGFSAPKIIYWLISNAIIQVASKLKRDNKFTYKSIICIEWTPSNEEQKFNFQIDLIYLFCFNFALPHNHHSWTLLTSFLTFIIVANFNSSYFVSVFYTFLISQSKITSKLARGFVHTIKLCICLRLWQRMRFSDCHWSNHKREDDKESKDLLCHFSSIVCLFIWCFI
jgi:hypothetical protein